MPKLDSAITDKSIASLPAATKGYIIYLDPTRDHFGVRVTMSGSKAWILERRLDGKTVRRTLGDADGARALSLKDALRQFKIVNGQLEGGKNEVAEDREERQAQAAQLKDDVTTFAVALREYVEKKRRRKDGLQLKARTKADYLQMIEPGGVRKDAPRKDGTPRVNSSKPKVDGVLVGIANIPLSQLTGDDLRELHVKLEKRGVRGATYAMQVVRAVLNWNGVKVPGNPLGKEVAERDRIILKPTVGKPNPITEKYLGAWWTASGSAGKLGSGGNEQSADYYRLQLITGCRGVEILGDKFGNDRILVRDVDLVENKIVRTDTKNRKDHKILLSRQALEIVKRNMVGKKQTDALFDVSCPGKTLRAINKAAGMRPDQHSGHDLRATFASVAAFLVDVYSLKAMINHTNAGDVTGDSYVKFGDERLRGAWQKVADFIEATADESKLVVLSEG